MPKLAKGDFISRLKSIADNRVRLDPQNNAVRSFFGTDLVELPPAALVGGAAAAMMPASKADSFLANNKDLFKLDNIEWETATHREGSATESITYQQHHDGVPVYGADLVVGIQKKDQRVASAVNHFDYEIPGAIRRSSARIDAKQAITIVQNRLMDRFHFQSLDISPNVTLFVYRHVAAANSEPIDASKRPIRAQMLSLGVGKIGVVYLVWQVLIDSHVPDGNWELLVDAVTSDFIAVKDRRRSANAYVYMPDPITSSRNASLSASTSSATLNAQRKQVLLANLNAGVNGHLTLDGKWCFCKDIENPTFAPPVVASGSDFLFDAKDRKFLSVMAYYWIDQIVTYLSAFNVPSYNKGVETTRIALDAQGFNGEDNSHFVPDNRNLPYIAFGEGGVPDASDAHVILHEYGHAMHWYMGSEQNHIGSEEGFGDFLAGTYLDQFNPSRFQRDSVFPWDNNATNQYTTERRFNTPRKFSDPDYSGLEIHVRGSVLAAALWDLFLSLGGDSSTPAVCRSAADTVVHLYMEMLVSAPNNAIVKDLANGMISADQAINAGANVSTIKTAFGDRGLKLP